jgi:hypothetical protein
MGFGDWIARKGNVGGAARSVAIGWKNIIKKNPQMSSKEIAEAYLKVRYGIMGEDDLHNTVQREINNDTINPLNLAWNILLAENEKAIDVVMGHTLEWRKIMREEIEKLGVDPE